MSDLGLRMMGKGTDGNAKAVKTDLQGNLGMERVVDIKKATPNHVFNTNEIYEVLDRATVNSDFVRLLFRTTKTSGKFRIEADFWADTRLSWRDTIEVTSNGAYHFVEFRARSTNLRSLKIVNISPTASGSMTIEGYSIIGVTNANSGEVRVLNDTLNPVNVKIVDGLSDLKVSLDQVTHVLPIDLQYHDIQDENPIPIKQKGKRKTLFEAQIAQTILAGTDHLVGEFDIGELSEFYASASFSGTVPTLGQYTIKYVTSRSGTFDGANEVIRMRTVAQEDLFYQDSNRNVMTKTPQLLLGKKLRVYISNGSANNVNLNTVNITGVY